ncbi:hypothetical protein BT96DRAFT_996261 [Gymnopus androsaceus JB14]|uniref:Uncharacterized protein n=1 Tax=Gymnopus androsaceus JB14 TaxID=1447944 RepID=A0A6A4HEJ7_9AGAR|nr:hypothetical protein BT96DRAFT_996261 [Gymnopus androsaceus JB14]
MKTIKRVKGRKAVVQIPRQFELSASGNLSCASSRWDSENLEMTRPGGCEDKRRTKKRKRFVSDVREHSVAKVGEFSRSVLHLPAPSFVRRAHCQRWHRNNLSLISPLTQPYKTRGSYIGRHTHVDFEGRHQQNRLNGWSLWRCCSTVHLSVEELEPCGSLQQNGEGNFSFRADPLEL